MIRKSALAASIAALLTPAVASALGLGNIQVTSALNEPLQARIPLRGADPGQLEELRVALADDQQFERAGLDRIFVLTKLKFEVVEAGSGSGFINLSTRDPVSEPFLNFLVDVNWARGRVLREYTVLLDPPLYGAAISSGTQRNVRTVETLPPAPAPVPRTAMAPRPAARAPMIATPTQGTPRYTGDSYGPVRQGETLWSIADRTRPAGTSIQSMMLALLRANPEAFSLDNVNALRTGAVLRIPPASELTGGKAAALEEVARQHALWAEYRQSISGSVSAQPGGAPPAPSTPPAAGSEPSTGTAASGGTGSGESSAELKLVGAGTTGAATGGGADVETLRNELTMAQEEADAAKLENQELQSRLTEVESLVGDLQRLVELKEDQLAALQDQLAKASGQAPAVPSPMPATETGSATPAAPESGTTESGSAESQTMTPKATDAEPKAAAAPKATEPPPAATKQRRAPPPPPPAPKSFMDDINDMLPVPLWTLLAGLGGVLLAFGGWRFARGRKEKEATADAAAVPGVAAGASMIEQYAHTEVPGEATDEDATELPETTAPPDGTLVEDADDDLSDMVATAQTTAAAPPDDEDPLAEVNVYLAYERFDQAEQLVRDAIASYPDRHDYKLKLLEVFYAAKNLMAFEVAAGELRDAVGDDHDMMQQAREWWADLGAGHELLSQDGGPSTNTGTQVPGAAADDELFDVTASEGEETGVDFDLGFDADDDSGSGGSSSLDFDLSADDADPAKSDDDSSLDFDLGSLGGAATVAGGAAIAGAAAAAASDRDLASGDAEKEEGAPAGQASDELDFNLDAGDDEAGDATGVDFDLSEPSDPDSPVSPDDVTEQRPSSSRLADADSDTGVDFDLGVLDDDVVSAGTATGADAGDDSLDFDLGDTAGTIDGGQAYGAGTLHDEAGEESGFDFDLGDTQSTDAARADTAGQASGAADPDSELDFDLGDTTSRPVAAGDEDSALDFDLGDTGPGLAGDDAASADDDSVLDFDLGDTHQSVRAGDEAAGSGAGTGDDAELDFDLGDTHQSVGAEDEQVGGATGTGVEDELDFDLGDTHHAVTAGDETPGGSSSTDAELDFDLSDTLGAEPGAESVDPEAELDFDLGDTASNLGADEASGVEDLGLDLGAETSATGGVDLSLDDKGEEQALDLDLSLDAGDGTADIPAGNEFGTGEVGDDSLPVIDMDGDDEESPAFDTVKLDPDTADSIRDSAGQASELGVDTEFRGIFSSSEEGDADATAGSESVLDFDLGSADLGADAEDEDAESTGFSDVESTQFMLSDISEDEGGQDEDDHTLVLGRGASGEVDEIQTKLDLAQAYMDMGDTEGARNLLGEVMADGDDPQKEQAGEMLKKLS